MLKLKRFDERRVFYGKCTFVITSTTRVEKNLTGEFIYGHKCLLNFFKINYKINWHVEIEFCKITDFTLKKTPFENAPS